MYEEAILFSFLLFIYLIFGIVCAIIAHSKGRNVIGWFFIGIVFALFGLILILCLPNLKDSSKERAIQETVNQRVQEQLRQERLKTQAFQNYTSGRLENTSARLDYHDNELGVETQDLGPSPIRIESPALNKNSPPPLSSFQNDAGQDWYYSSGGQSFGPVSQNQLVSCIRDGIINSETLVYEDTYENWIKASQVNELKKYFEFYS